MSDDPGTTIPGEPAHGVDDGAKSGDLTVDSTQGAKSVAVLQADIALDDFEIGDFIDVTLDNAAVDTFTIEAISPFGSSTVFSFNQFGGPGLSEDASIGNNLTAYRATVTEKYTVDIPASQDEPYDAENNTNFDVSTLETKQVVGHSEQLLICDRTGFKIAVSDGLVEEWNGRMVRKSSFEVRHPMDYIRATADDVQDGSPSPEQDDMAIADEFPSGVSADTDLDP